MAATDIKVSAGGFTPELWSEKININLDNIGAYNDIVNRKYEGEIKAKGDRVTFYTIGNLTVSDYDPTDENFKGITYQDPKGQKQTLIVDQQKIVPFLVDDIQAVQSNIELVNQYTKRIAVAASDVKDTYIHSLAVAGATTKLNATTALEITKANVWKTVCDMHTILARKKAITKQGLDYSGKRPALVVTPEFQGMLLQAEQYFANAFGNNVLRTGQIGHIGIFDVFLDTNITVDATSKAQTIVALTSDAITYAEQITKTETLRDKDQVGDYVRSLMVYGGLVANPDCIVTNNVKVA